MAFSLSDLLNPVPLSGNATPIPGSEDVAQPPPSDFAPELFQSGDNTSLAQENLAALAADAAHTLEQQTGTSGLDPIPSLKQEDSVPAESRSLPQWPTDGAGDPDTVMISQDDDPDADSVPLSQQKSAGKEKKSKTPKDGDGEKDLTPKASKHSSKNEGQHTDRRYLCYLCTKLFTRRRSVRDHIAKIHNVKSWEPVRSLEVIVEPTTGEPIEPLEDIIARGPPPPPPKTPKAPKEKQPKEENDDAPEEAQVNEQAEREIAPSVSETEIEGSKQSPPPISTAPVVLHPEPSVKDEKIPVLVTKASSPESTSAPIPVIGKKRPAPEVSKPLPTAITKKGIAKPRPLHTPNKRAKLSDTDSISEKGTPLRSPSTTPAVSARAPASKLKKQFSARKDGTPTPTSSRMASIEPASPSPSAADTPGSSNDDGEIFCICRKGDNHTWMIACDGGCDEWYHGNCVNIRERDGDLIDRYICPRCTRAGLQTTWKRMCRRKSCRKPARVFQDPPSKYCSKECGRMFFVELIRRGDPYIDTMKNDQFVVDGGRPKKLRKKRQRSEHSGKQKVSTATPIVNGEVGELGNSDSRLATPAPSDEEKSEYETDSSAGEDELPNRGGALRAGEVKAIVEKCKSIDRWKQLGGKPDTPPREPDEKELALNFDEFELKKLEEIGTEKERLNKRTSILEAREKMLNLIKIRSTGITEELKKDAPKDKKGSAAKKDPCGFDARVAWSEETFLDWYENHDGKVVLETGRIGPPDDHQSSVDSDKKMSNGIPNGDESDDDSEEKDMPKKGGVCVRNRCPRHKSWIKATLAEIRFEQDGVRKAIRRCEDLETDVRERAVVRAWERR